MSSEFFENKDCQYYPCHKMKGRLNCLFCYCPLYFIQCPGNPKTLPGGIKDCSDCTLPHGKDGYSIIIKALSDFFRYRADPGHGQDQDFADAWQQSVVHTIHHSTQACRRDKVSKQPPLPELRHLKYLCDQLPPVIARKSIRKIFGGAVSIGTLANADSKGTGPKVKFNVGRDIVYPTIYLLEWMEKKGMRLQISPGWRADD